MKKISYVFKNAPKRVCAVVLSVALITSASVSVISAANIQKAETSGIGTSIKSAVKGFLTTKVKKAYTNAIGDLADSTDSKLIKSYYDSLVGATNTKFNKLQQSMDELQTSVDEIQDSISDMDTTLNEMYDTMQSDFWDIQTYLREGTVHDQYKYINDWITSSSCNTAWLDYKDLARDMAKLDGLSGDELDKAKSVIESDFRKIVVQDFGIKSDDASDAEIAVGNMYNNINSLANIVADCNILSGGVSNKPNATGDHDTNHMTYTKALLEQAQLEVPFEHQVSEIMQYAVTQQLQLQIRYLTLFNEVYEYCKENSEDNVGFKAAASAFEGRFDSAYNLTVNSINNAGEQSRLNTLMCDEDMYTQITVDNSTQRVYRVKTVNDTWTGDVYYIGYDPVYHLFYQSWDKDGNYIYPFRNGDHNPYLDNKQTVTAYENNTNVGSITRKVGDLPTINTNNTADKLSDDVCNLGMFYTDCFEQSGYTPIDYLELAGLTINNPYGEEDKSWYLDDATGNNKNINYILTAMPNSLTSSSDTWPQGSSVINSNSMTYMKMEWLRANAVKSKSERLVNTYSHDQASYEANEDPYHLGYLLVLKSSEDTSKYNYMVNLDDTKGGLSSVTATGGVEKYGNYHYTALPKSELSVSATPKPYHEIKSISYTKTNSGNNFNNQSYCVLDSPIVNIPEDGTSYADALANIPTYNFTVGVPYDDIDIKIDSDWIDLGNYLTDSQGQNTKGTKDNPYIIDSQSDVDLLSAMHKAGYPISKLEKAEFRIIDFEDSEENGGLGTTDEPYYISDEQDMQLLENLADAGLNINGRVTVFSMIVGDGSIDNPYVISSQNDLDMLYRIKNVGIDISKSYYTIYKIDGLGTSDRPYVINDTSDIDAIKGVSDKLTLPTSSYSYIFGKFSGIGTQDDPFKPLTQEDIDLLVKLKTELKVDLTKYSFTISNLKGIGTQSNPYVISTSNDITTIKDFAKQIGLTTNKFTYAFSNFAGIGTADNPYNPKTEQDINLLSEAKSGLGIVINEKSVALGFLSGSGTKDDPYIIETSQQIDMLNEMISIGVDISKYSISVKSDNGSGTKEDPYLIDSKASLDNLSELMDMGIVSNSIYAQLVNDIDCSYKPFETINNFRGTIDGNGHKIYNISAVNNFIDSLYGSIQNIAFYYDKNSCSKDDEICVVYRNYGTISGCSFFADNSDCIGISGFAENNYGTISNCKSEIKTNSAENIEQICGICCGQANTVNNCTVNISVANTSQNVSNMAAYGICYEGENAMFTNCTVNIDAPKTAKTVQGIANTLTSCGVESCNTNITGGILVNGISSVLATESIVNKCNTVISVGKDSICSGFVALSGTQSTITECTSNVTAVDSKKVCGAVSNNIGRDSWLLGNTKATIKDCIVAVNFTNCEQSAGVSLLNKGVISECVASGTIIGGNNSAGLVLNNQGTLSDCKSLVTIGDPKNAQSTLNAAGIVYENNGSGAQIVNCYNLGNISAFTKDTKSLKGAVAGIVAVNNVKNDNKANGIYNCYNTGKIVSDGTDTVGKIVGYSSIRAFDNVQYCISADGNDKVPLVGNAKDSKLFANNHLKEVSASYLKSDEFKNELNQMVNQWNNASGEFAKALKADLSDGSLVTLSLWERNDNVNSGYPYHKIVASNESSNDSKDVVNTPDKNKTNPSNGSSTQTTTKPVEKTSNNSKDAPLTGQTLPIMIVVLLCTSAMFIVYFSKRKSK